jgi:hypothetical protein
MGDHKEYPMPLCARLEQQTDPPRARPAREGAVICESGTHAARYGESDTSSHDNDERRRDRSCGEALPGISAGGPVLWSPTR